MINMLVLILQCLKILKDINNIARDVIQGKFGNGLTRKRKLEALGYDYLEVQKEVNKLI